MWNVFLHMQQERKFPCQKFTFSLVNHRFSQCDWLHQLISSSYLQEFHYCSTHSGSRSCWMVFLVDTVSSWTWFLCTVKSQQETFATELEADASYVVWERARWRETSSWLFSLCIYHRRRCFDIIYDIVLLPCCGEHSSLWAKHLHDDVKTYLQFHVSATWGRQETCRWGDERLLSHSERLNTEHYTDIYQ